MRPLRPNLLILVLLVSVACNGVAAWNWYSPSPTFNKIWLDEVDHRFDAHLGKAARTLATAEAEANFTIGLARRLHGESSLCPALGGRSYFFCAEGESYAKAVAYLRQTSNAIDPRPLISERGEEQMGLGMALSSLGVERLQDFLMSTSKSYQSKYLVDGWGFGVAMASGTSLAVSSCNRLPSDVRSYCIWGVGRSLWFLGNEPPGVAEENRTALQAGRIFARRFAGQISNFSEEETSVRATGATLQIADLLTGKKPATPPSETLGKCLLAEHLFDCALSLAGVSK